MRNFHSTRFQLQHTAAMMAEYLKNVRLNLSLEEFTTILAATREPIGDRWEQGVFDACKQDGDIVKGVADFCVKTDAQGGKQALALYKISMDYGKNDAAGVSYATLLYRGTGGVEQDVIKASTILEALAKKGNPSAQMNYATLLSRQANPDTHKIIELLELASRNGQLEASGQLGRMYLQAGKMNKALSHLQVAATGGHAQSAYILGTLYSAPLEGVDMDYAKAFQYYVQAASLGMMEAQYNVGHLYMTGKGTPQDLKLAHEYWKLAADQGFPLAQINVAKMYMDGHGVTRNVEMASKYLQMAANGQGAHAEQAQRLLEQCKKKGKEGCCVM
jgi:TPR repeat protein